MPRNKPSKTDRNRATPADIKVAVDKVIKENFSIREAAEMCQISKSKLSRHVIDARQHEESDFCIRPRMIPNQIFTTKQEDELESYLIKASKLNHGLTTIATRRLAYEFAKSLHLKFPENWNSDGKAGREWLYGFMKRHKGLSIRSPEATSLARATSFNKTNVQTFYKNLSEVYAKYAFQPHRIFNCDETGCTTVQKPPRVIASKSQKQVGQVTSAEKGKTVTVCCFISASGNTIPPVFVFPRATSTSFLTNGAPHGSLALVHKSGWMTAENFLIVMKHFVQHTNATKENPVLLLLDNHDSHISIDVIIYAKEHGVVMLTFPPHCSHKLQPLDVSVYAPFKSRYYRAMNDWMLSNPGKTISYYNVPSLMNDAFMSSMTPKNITSGFESTGIYPLNSDNFSDSDFLSSYVTNRPDPTVQEEISPSTSGQNCASSVDSPQTLEEVCPFPKAGPRKESNRGRKRGRSAIYTSTPEKERLLEESLRREASKSRHAKKNTKKAKYVKKNEFSSSSDDEEQMLRELIKLDSTRKPKLSDLCDDSSSEASNLDFQQNCESGFPEYKEKLIVGDYALVKFSRKRDVIAFVGRVLTVDAAEYEMSFLRRQDKHGWLFFYPEKEDRSFVIEDDILLKLKIPKDFVELRRPMLEFDAQQFSHVQYSVC